MVGGWIEGANCPETAGKLAKACGGCMETPAGLAWNWGGWTYAWGGDRDPVGEVTCTPGIAGIGIDWKGAGGVGTP